MSSGQDIGNHPRICSSQMVIWMILFLISYCDELHWLLSKVKLTLYSWDYSTPLWFIILLCIIIFDLLKLCLEFVPCVVFSVFLVFQMHVWVYSFKIIRNFGLVGGDFLITLCLCPLLWDSCYMYITSCEFSPQFTNTVLILFISFVPLCFSFWIVLLLYLHVLIC